jgi:FAD/FMN-containing dehydrogenase
MTPWSALTGILLRTLVLVGLGDARIGQKVSSFSLADVRLFDSERIQLTDRDIAALSQNVRPWFDELHELGIPFQPNTTYYDNFHDGWMAGFPRELVGETIRSTGSRLFPRKNWESPKSFNATFDALRSTITAGFGLLAFNMKAELQKGFTPNAANPAFRQMLMHAITSTEWTNTTSDSAIKSKMDYLTNNVIAEWRAVCPDSGAYMSESDIQEPDFQQAFYGTNYERLYKLKQRYDPTFLFYAPTGVGSEDWVVKSVDGLPDQNGRLCRV